MQEMLQLFTEAPTRHFFHATLARPTELLRRHACPRRGLKAHAPHITWDAGSWVEQNTYHITIHTTELNRAEYERSKPSLLCPN